MQYATALLALAAAAAAMPSAVEVSAKRDAACTFGTYSCMDDDSGIQICDVAGKWQPVGPCPDGTACENLPQNGFELPFCTAQPPSKEKEKRGYGWCATPGQYSCLGWGAIQVCDIGNSLRKVGDCPPSSHCSYISGIPYCVANY